MADIIFIEEWLQKKALEKHLITALKTGEFTKWLLKNYQYCKEDDSLEDMLMNVKKKETTQDMKTKILNSFGTHTICLQEEN